MSVLAIIAVLTAMIIPLHNKVRGQMEKANCASNLRSLQLAAAAYVQDEKTWPAISTVGLGGEEYTQQWYEALEPYGVSWETWWCPTVTRLGGWSRQQSIDNVRADYIGAKFSKGEFKPYQYSVQPWFAEKANVHGNGQLLVFPDGSVKELGDFSSN